MELDISSWSDGWLPLAVVRSTDAHELRGGFSGFLAAFFRQVFLDPEDSLSSFGVLVDIRPDPLVFLAKLGSMVCDGDSHRQAIACKGAGGTMTCQLCKNITTDEALVAADASGYLRSIRELSLIHI